MPKPDPRLLALLERKVLWLATWMIHNANHQRPNPDHLKVGGHQASSASLSTIMTALYFAVLRPEDRVAVKPHASPNFHAIQYLLGRQTRDKLENFRAFGGAQSYPSRTKDTDDVDFSTGSVGLGVAQTLFAGLVQDYLRAKGLARGPEGRMIALVGDAELDEGNIFEALQEGWKHGLRNTWWVVDYNRQSLDGVVHEGLWEKFETMFRNFGWDVIVLRHGSLQQAAFAKPGGERLRDWISACANPLYAALTFQGGAAWRKRLAADLAGDNAALSLIHSFSDDELAAIMSNLGGHDMPLLLDAFEQARQHDRPVCFIAYTIKGYGLPLAGHKDNHAGILTPEQMERLRERLDIRTGHEWDHFEGLEAKPAEIEAFLAKVPFAGRPRARATAPRFALDAMPVLNPQKSASTQQGFGLLMNALARETNPLVDRIVTTSPDVTVSTNLGPWVNRRGLFARDEVVDTFQAEHILSTFNWSFSPGGQHMELGIAEMNLFLLLSALGLSHDVFGERLLPVGTLYDPFIERGLDALNYACYQDARFMLVATPSGITLAPEGGAHQSIATPLIGMAQDGLQSFEPAFVDELAAIMGWGFDYMQRSGDAAPARNCLPDGRGGALYLRLSTRAIEQPSREMSDSLRQDIIDGAYWMRKPGPNAEIVLAYTGAVAPEAIAATGMMAEDRRDVGLLAITSADRLHAGWNAAHRLREGGARQATSHIERLMSDVPRDCRLLSVQDGHPAGLAWLGSVAGHRSRALGVEHFGQSGSIADLYRYAGIDTESLVTAAEAIAPGRPIRHLRAV